VLEQGLAIVAGCAATLKPLFTGFRGSRPQASIGAAGELTCNTVQVGAWDPGLTIRDGGGEDEKDMVTTFTSEIEAGLDRNESDAHMLADK